MFVIRRPVLVLVLLTALNLLNYLDRFVLSAVLPKIEGELGLSKFVQGALATVFLVGFFATSPIFGILGDRGRRTRLVAVGVGLWCIATVTSGLATGVWSLLLSRALVGVGEASFTTLAPTLIDDIAPPERKGRWLSVFYAATPIGSALGFFTGGLVEGHWGWRAAFFVAGGPGILLALLCFFMAEPARKMQATREAWIPVIRELLPMRIYRRAVLGYAAYAFAIGGLAFWAPTLIYRAYDVPLKTANLRFGAITVAMGFVGAVLGGFLGDRSARKDRGEPDPDRNSALGYLWTCSWSAGLGAVLTAVALASGSAGMFFASIVPCQAALFISMSPINAAILRSVPEERRATAMALSVFAIHAFGDLWSPPLVGLLADHIHIGNAMQILAVAFAIGAVLWFVPSKKTPKKNEEKQSAVPITN